MHRTVTRVKGFAFILWHARHEMFHVLFGLIWAWILRELWLEFNPRWFLLSVFGALLPDADHLWYFFGHGKNDEYTKQIRQFLRDRKWRVLTVFIETGHKYNTNLSSHNIFFTLLIVGTAVASYTIDWKAGTILLGAMATHYAFDMFDDIVTLGRINPNWKRWGRPRRVKPGV